MNMMMMISFLLICCYLFTKTASSSSSDTTTLTYRQCFETLFNLTQSCSNHNYFYATNIGVASNNNFISEFNEYLMKILLRAIYTNRRFIYLQTNRTWKYNCEEGKGWACYFSFTPCLDGTVTPADMDMSRLPSNDYITDPGNAYMDREDMNNYHFNAVFVYFRTIEIDRFYQGQALLAPNICDQFPESMIPSITADGLAGPIAKHLFRLNNKTISIINMMNRRYEHLQNKTFVSVLLDNQSNIIDPVALPKASNATWISSQILHITTIITSKKIHVRNIFMVTDNCTLAGKVLSMLLPKDIRIYGSCFHTDGKRVIDSPPVPSGLRRQLKKATITDAMHEAYTEIAEIEMLRRGAVLISTMQSDRGRLVHYLRYPHYANTHYLIPSMFDESGVNPITFCF